MFTRALDLYLGQLGPAPREVNGTLLPMVRASLAKTPAPARPLECYEIRLPYRDPIEARLTGQPADATLSVVVRAWASDVEAALDSARDLFATLRRRGARLVDAEPVVRRLAIEGTPRAA
jgi:hypothetical protein